MNSGVIKLQRYIKEMEEAWNVLLDRAVELKARVDELEKENESLKNAWISVDERLPDDDVDVICGAWDDVFSGYHTEAGWFMSGIDMKATGVEFWQPMPKLPDVE